MNDKVKITVKVDVGLVRSTRTAEFIVDRQEWAGMTQQERDRELADFEQQAIDQFVTVWVESIE